MSIDQALLQLRMALEEVAALSGPDLGTIEIVMKKKAAEPAIRALSGMGAFKYAPGTDDFRGLGFSIRGSDYVA